MDVKAEPCCGVYWATRNQDLITLHALGQHRTSGYQVFFVGEKAAEYTFYHLVPTSGRPVITPFCHSVTFAADSIEFVIVRDANGAHKIPVEKVPECGGITLPEAMRDLPGTEREKD